MGMGMGMGMENCNFWEVFLMGLFLGSIATVFLIGLWQILIQDFRPQIKNHRLLKMFKK